MMFKRINRGGRRGLCRQCQRKAIEKWLNERLFILHAVGSYLSEVDVNSLTPLRFSILDALLNVLYDEFYGYLVYCVQEAGSFAATAA
nr:hypothetical protein Iba_chr03aCG15780 [Ipomoea batatas]GMC76876.1 hypothetical protein Iba_chr03eCG5350 [Ipomoea batatas]GME02568.1 hypothetical protein Iba_scaffold137CG0510 [Ipomoea batatas]